MSHTMNQPQTDVGETHPGNILPQRHPFRALRVALYGSAQRAANHLDGLQMQHVG